MAHFVEKFLIVESLKSTTYNLQSVDSDLSKEYVLHDFTVVHSITIYKYVLSHSISQIIFSDWNYSQNK